MPAASVTQPDVGEDRLSDREATSGSETLHVESPRPRRAVRPEGIGVMRPARANLLYPSDTSRGSRATVKPKPGGRLA
jgi:hypothetical protein